jgi:hypothetical protein
MATPSPWGEGRGEGGRQTLLLNAIKSGGERARTPDASRDSRTPGSREASGLRVSLAPLSDGARNSTQSRQDAKAQRKRLNVSAP